MPQRRKRKILVILRQKFYLRNTIITFARFSDFSAQVDFHLIGHFLLYSKRKQKQVKREDQYIKDCEAGAGRTPSVRRRK